MKKRLQDERIIQETLKLNSLGFTILYFGILLDLLYRQFILQEHVSKYWDLALLFFGVTFILAVRHVSSGFLTDKLNMRRNIPSSIVAAIVFSVVNYWWVGNKSAVELIISFIIFFSSFYGINLLMQYFSSKKNENMLKD